MKLLNSILALIVVVLSLLPFIAPQREDYVYNYIYGLANGKIACHCDTMKEMEESLRQNYMNNNKFAYIIDCNTADKQTRSQISQFRTAISSQILPISSVVSVFIYPTQNYSPYTRTFLPEIPPPRYCA